MTDPVSARRPHYPGANLVSGMQNAWRDARKEFCIWAASGAATITAAAAAGHFLYPPADHPATLQDHKLGGFLTFLTLAGCVVTAVNARKMRTAMLLNRLKRNDPAAPKP